MIKAIVKNGVMVPRDPLPADWQEGTEVDVEKSPNGEGEGKNGIHSTDAWMDEVESIARQGDTADDLRRETAVRDARRREKEPEKSSWPCKAGSYRKIEFWMAPDFNTPLEEFKDYME